MVCSPHSSRNDPDKNLNRYLLSSEPCSGSHFPQRWHLLSYPQWFTCTCTHTVTSDLFYHTSPPTLAHSTGLLAGGLEHAAEYAPALKTSQCLFPLLESSSTRSCTSFGSLLKCTWHMLHHLTPNTVPSSLFAVILKSGLFLSSPHLHLPSCNFQLSLSHFFLPPLLPLLSSAGRDFELFCYLFILSVY